MVIRVLCVLILSSYLYVQSGEEAIVVSAKLYDQNSLNIMLEDLERRLAEVRVLDREKVSAGLGAIQGQQATFSSLKVSSSELANPTKFTEDPTSADAVAGAPSASTPSAGLLPEENPSLSARSRLAEQVMLEYQITNLRLMLNRSLSDRYNFNEKDVVKQKRHIMLLGFQVSIKDALPRQVAEISVTIEEKKNESNGKFKSKDSDGNPTLVILLPQKNTYNVATIKTSSQDLGLGIITGVFQSGIGWFGMKQNFYLVQDIDTVAFEAVAQKQKTVSFGWQFRPVLGEKSVSPGIRHVFALVSLPTSQEEQTDVTVQVSTCWKKWNHRKKRVGNRIGESKYPLNDKFTIYRLDKVVGFQKPRVGNVSWSFLDNGRAHVTVTGEQMDTVVAVGAGNQVLGGTDLVRTSQDRLDFQTDLSKVLTYGDPWLLGKYGNRIALLNDMENPESAAKIMITPHSKDKILVEADGIITQTDSIFVEPESAQSLLFYPDPPSLSFFNAEVREVSYFAADQAKVVLETEGMAFQYPIVVLGNTLIGTPETPFSQRTKDELEFVVPADLIRKPGPKFLQIPFYEKGRVDLNDLKLNCDFSAQKVTTLAENKDGLVMCISGSDLEEVEVFKLEAGKPTNTVPLVEGSSRNLIFHLSWDDLGAIKALFLRKKCADQNNNGSYQIGRELIMPLNPEPVCSRPKFTEIPEVKVNDSNWILVKGSDFECITEIRFEESPAKDKNFITLPHRVIKTGLEIRIASQLTKKAGIKDLDVHLKAGGSVRLRLTVKAPSAN